MMERLLSRMLRQEPQISEEEARRLLAEQMSDDPLGELYNFGSAAAMSGAGLTSLAADAVRSTGLLDEEAVLEEVPPRRPELSEIPGTYEWGMEQVGAEPYAPESFVGSLMDPGSLAMAGAIPAKVMANALREGKIGQYPTTTAGRIRNRTKDNGGYTVDLMTGEIPTSGIMMGTYANDSGKTGVFKDAKMVSKDVSDWVKKNAKALSEVDNHLGTWISQADNTLYMDVAKRFAPEELRKATKFGEETGQLAGFNLGTFEETPVGNWQQFVNSDEFAQRMDDMARIGREYMDQQPTKEWWDVYGTLFEEIYGTERIEQLVGFVASTSPRTDPTTNMRVASEYMRRLLKGEDIIQPNWRRPEGTQAGTPGAKMPMEQQRKKNLELSAEGRYKELTGPKVNDMARALAGDPDAAVMDRWYARGTEKPEAGVFTGPDEAVIPPSKKWMGYEPYEEAKNAVSRAARKAGRDPRDFSADAWVGMREVAKNTGELFGQKMKSSAIAGESKGIADLFTDLVESKAKFLGISVSEMKARLAAGDANLLSMMLATPIGAWLFAQVLADAEKPENGHRPGTQ